MSHLCPIEMSDCPFKAMALELHDTILDFQASGGIILRTLKPQDLRDMDGRH